MGSSHIGMNKKAWSYKIKQGRPGHIRFLHLLAVSKKSSKWFPKMPPHNPYQKPLQNRLATAIAARQSQLASLPTIMLQNDQPSQHAPPPKKTWPPAAHSFLRLPCRSIARGVSNLGTLMWKQSHMCRTPSSNWLSQPSEKIIYINIWWIKLDTMPYNSNV